MFCQKAQTIIDLQERGYDYDFVLDKEAIWCVQCDVPVYPDDFEIVEVHHCGAQLDESSSCVIYGIRLYNYDIKGIMMSRYKALYNGVSIRMWSKLNNAVAALTGELACA